MDFVTVEGRALRAALRVLVDVVDRRCSVPILSFVKLTLSAEGLRLEATDLDLSVAIKLDVIDGGGEWSAALPAHALAGMARVAGPMALRIEPGSPATVILNDGEATYSLQSLPAADFPEMVDGPGELLERFGNGRLGELLGKVSAFISTEETRYYLNGIAWQQGAFGSLMVATDGHRLGLCGYDREAREPQSRIVPRKAVTVLRKHFAGYDVAVHAGAGPLKLVFASGSMSLCTKLIDGTYPDVDRVVTPAVSGAASFALPLNRPEALAASARLSVFGRDIGRAIRFDAQDGTLSLSRKSDAGGAVVRLSSAWPEGLQPFGVNAVYFGDMIAGCTGDVELRLGKAGDPLVLRDADPEMVRILMPMRV